MEDLYRGDWSFLSNNLLLFRLSKVISLAAKVTNLFVRCHEKDLIWFKKNTLLEIFMSLMMICVKYADNSSCATGILTT